MEDPTLCPKADDEGVDVLAKSVGPSTTVRGGSEHRDRDVHLTGGAHGETFSRWKAKTDKAETEERHHNGFKRWQQCNAETRGHQEIHDSRNGRIMARSPLRGSK